MSENVHAPRPETIQTAPPSVPQHTQTATTQQAAPQQAMTPEQREIMEMFSEAMQIVMEFAFMDPEEDREELKELHARARKLARKFYKRLRISVR